MFSNEWLTSFLSLLILMPAAIACYLPAKNRMVFSMSKALLLCSAVIIPFSLAGACVLTAFKLNINIILLPAMLGSFFLYRLTVRLDLSRALAIYIGVCAIQTFPSQFSNFVNIYFTNGVEEFTVQAALIHLGLSGILTAAFAYPARNYLSKIVDLQGMSGAWFSTVPLSLIFLIANILVIPRSYDFILESRFKYLFPVLEAFGLATLIMIYLLFYRAAIIIIEHTNLEKWSQLLEMQAHQFSEQQAYMRQTERLRHDFRQSVHLLAALAEKGDLDSIREHLSQYEQRFAESVSVNYCANSALNALFAYYKELADSEGIKTDWKIELPDPLTVSELDMAALFGNLMENAIAACSALPEERRYFSLTSEMRHTNALYIVSTNSFDGKVRKHKNGYLSTKHPGTGTGLISIAAVAEKYGGTAQVNNSETEFFIDVMMKI